MSASQKHRACPALNREITSAECGENRNSSYRCTAECQFNPFAPENYAHALEAEARFDDLAVRFLTSEPLHGERIARLGQKLDPSNVGEIDPFVCYELSLHRDDQGLTCLQRWEKLGFPDLKNDLRVFARAKMNSTVRLLEARRILDAEQVEFLDLLDTARGAIVVRDRTTAARACRYDIFLSFAFDLPLYSRLVSGAVMFPFWSDRAPDDGGI